MGKGNRVHLPCVFQVVGQDFRLRCAFFRIEERKEFRVGLFGEGFERMRRIRVPMRAAVSVRVDRVK